MASNDESEANPDTPPEPIVDEATAPADEAPTGDGNQTAVDRAFEKWHREHEPSPGFMTYKAALATAAALAQATGRGELGQAQIHVLLTQYNVQVVAQHMHVGPQNVAPGMLHGAKWIFDVERNSCRPRNEPNYPENWLWLEVNYAAFFGALRGAGIVEAVPGDLVIIVGDDTEIVHRLVGYDDQGNAHVQRGDSGDVVDVEAAHVRYVEDEANSQPTPQAASPASAPRGAELGPSLHEHRQVPAGDLDHAGNHVCRSCGARPYCHLMNIDGPIPLPIGWKMIGMIPSTDGPPTVIEFCGVCIPVLRNL